MVSLFSVEWRGSLIAFTPRGLSTLPAPEMGRKDGEVAHSLIHSLIHKHLVCAYCMPGGASIRHSEYAQW